MGPGLDLRQGRFQFQFPDYHVSSCITAYHYYHGSRRTQVFSRRQWMENSLISGGGGVGRDSMAWTAIPVINLNLTMYSVPVVLLSH